MPDIQWDTQPDTSALMQQPTQTAAPQGVQWDAQPDTSALAQPQQDTFGGRLSSFIQHPIDTITGQIQQPGQDANDKGEQDKSAIWTQAKGDFQSGNFKKAAGDLLGLLDTSKNSKWNEHGSFSQAGIGLLKGAGQTLSTAAQAGQDMATLGLDRLVKPQAMKDAESQIDESLKPSNPDQQAGANMESVIEFALGDEALKGLSLAQRLAQSSKIASVMEKYPRIANILGDAMRNATVGGTVGGVHNGVEGAVQGATTGALAGGTLSALGELPGAVSDLRAATPEADAQPSLLKQVVKGEDVNQPAAQSAVRNAVQSSAKSAGTDTDQLVSDINNQPILKNGQTVIDDHLNALRQNEKAAYQQVDDTVGFDLKAERAQLSNDQYKLSQLGNTDADINARGNLIEAINDSEGRIADAQAKLKNAGIDPKAADGIHQQRMAGMDFKKALVQSTAPDGTVNVDSLLNKSKALRFSKFGDRLTQFFGSQEAADSYMSQLQLAHELGVHAMKWNGIGKLVGKWIAGGLIGGGAAGLGYEVLK
jgi:hypothetical protein